MRFPFLPSRTAPRGGSASRPCFVLLLFLTLLFPGDLPAQLKMNPREEALVDAIFKAAVEVIKDPSDTRLNTLVKKNKALVARFLKGFIRRPPRSEKEEKRDAYLTLSAILAESFLKVHGKGPKGERAVLLRGWAQTFHSEAYERRNRSDSTTFVLWLTARALYKEIGDRKI